MIAQVNLGGVEAILDGLLPKLLAPATIRERPELVEEVRRIARAQPASGVAGALAALRDRPDAGAGLARIAVPVLVLVGRDDAITPPACAEAMANLARARLEILDGAGHLSNLEQPQTFNDAVVQFLRSLS
jgi:pimeloyl-ACP methyl ester carboxylesterase